MVFDVSLEGTEAQKNAQLAPSAPVPALDREVAEAQGVRVGLEPIRSTDAQPVSKPDPAAIPGAVKPSPPADDSKSDAAPLYRAVSQDEMMGYDDDFEDEEADDDADYF